MQVLNISTGYTPPQTAVPKAPTQNKLPKLNYSQYDLESFEFRWGGEVFGFFQFQAFQFVPFRIGDKNRYIDDIVKPTPPDFLSYMDKHFPNWSNV